MRSFLVPATYYHERAQSASTERSLAKKASDIGHRIVRSEGKLGSSRAKALQRITTYPHAVLVQVGANDGRFDDPIHDILAAERTMHAVLIEPQEAPFSKLQTLYRNHPNVRCFRAAIANTAGSLTLWHPRFEIDDGGFGAAIACADPEQVKKIMRRHPLRKMHSYSMQSEVVPARTLGDVLEEAQLSPDTVSAFFCDAEGADIDITHQLLDITHPPIIQYEHHLARHADVTALNQRLEISGYGLSWSYRDVLALQ